MCVQKCERFKIPFPKVFKKITQDVGFDDMAMTQVISSTTQGSTIFERYHRECRGKFRGSSAGEAQLFTDIAVRHLG